MLVLELSGLPNTGNTTNFYNITASGTSNNNNNASNSYGVVCGFPPKSGSLMAVKVTSMQAKSVRDGEKENMALAKSVNKYPDASRRTLLAWCGLQIIPHYMPADAMHLYVICRQVYGVSVEIDMTSEERREVRYLRRHQARELKKAERTAQYDNFDNVFQYGNMYEAYRKCRRGVAWKSSVQKYIARAPLEVYRTCKQLHNGKYKSPGFYEFDLVERGKKRHIRSTTIGERVVQRCLCDNALVPTFQRFLIHDNGATMPKKGYDFAMRRYEQHLREHYRKHGTDGWVLTFDFSAFFDNVSHEVLDNILRSQFTDMRIISLTEHLISMFGSVGLGLGSQISQVLALSSANRLDHVMKEQQCIRGYGRYMDDGYIIHHDKNKLKSCLIALRSTCRELGIKLNEKKTHIMKITRTTWLKARFILTNSGKIIKKMCRRNITKWRQKLKKMRGLLDMGKISFADILNSWTATLGYAKRFNSWHTRMSMTTLFHELFRRELMIYGIYQSA